MPLGDVIDFGKERTRLEKELKKAQDEIERFDAKLSNEQFVSRAPEDVLNEQRESGRKQPRLRIACVKRLAGLQIKHWRGEPADGTISPDRH